MKKYLIPGFGDCIIYTILLDLNGTINYYGKRPKFLKDYIEKLKTHFNIYIASANTRGDLDRITGELGVEGLQLNSDLGEQDAKLELVSKLDPETTIMIGNGNNDVKALKEARIGIAVLGSEGASSKAIMNSDLCVSNVIDAFKIIMDGRAMIATLRK